MNTTFDILVIALSCLLAVFLILSIVALSLVLKLLKSLRQVVAKGEHLVDTAEDIGDTLRRNAGAVGLVKLLMQFITTAQKARRK